MQLHHTANRFSQRTHCARLRANLEERHRSLLFADLVCMQNSQMIRWPSCIWADIEPLVPPS